MHSQSGSLVSNQKTLTKQNLSASTNIPPAYKLPDINDKRSNQHPYGGFNVQDGGTIDLRPDALKSNRHKSLSVARPKKLNYY